MTAPRKNAFTAVCLLAALALGTAWCYSALVTARASLQIAAMNLDDCRRLSARIRDLRHHPKIAGSQDQQVEQLARLIEDSALEVGLTTEHIPRILPEPARRVEDSAYLLKSTQVFLRRLTLRQLVRFLHQVKQRQTGLQVGSLRLSAPRGQETGRTWTVETTLSYLIYAPKKPESQKSL